MYRKPPPSILDPNSDDPVAFPFDAELLSVKELLNSSPLTPRRSTKKKRSSESDVSSTPKRLKDALAAPSTRSFVAFKISRAEDSQQGSQILANDPASQETVPLTEEERSWRPMSAPKESRNDQELEEVEDELSHVTGAVYEAAIQH